MSRLIQFAGVILAVLLAAWAAASGFQFAGVILAVLLAVLLNGRHSSR